MSNLEIREFSQAIINFVDSSGLPEEVKLESKIAENAFL